MSAGILAMLMGAFIVPGILLWAGHRIRRRSPRWRATFWGGVAGHVIALVLASLAAMNPAETWSDANVVRGAFGLWSLLILPMAGAAMGSLRAR